MGTPPARGLPRRGGRAPLRAAGITEEGKELVFPGPGFGQGPSHNGGHGAGEPGAILFALDVQAPGRSQPLVSLQDFQEGSVTANQLEPALGRDGTAAVPFMLCQRFMTEPDKHLVRAMTGTDGEKRTDAQVRPPLFDGDDGHAINLPSDDITVAASGTVYRLLLSDPARPRF